MIESWGFHEDLTLEAPMTLRSSSSRSQVVVVVIVEVVVVAVVVVVVVEVVVVQWESRNLGVPSFRLVIFYFKIN